FASLFHGQCCRAAGGVLRLDAEDETSQQPCVAKLQLYRADGRPQLVRGTLPTGGGVILSESLELALPDGAYQFRLTRGPEYRIVQGSFTLERTSQDERTVKLPRMVDMNREGWTACDMAVPPKTSDLQLRMMAEDLHLACVVGAETPLTPKTFVTENITLYEPLWTSHHHAASHDDDLLFYRAEDATSEWKMRQGETSSGALERLTADASVRVAVANPFAWSLPVWLATEQIDGFFVLGDWLREERRVEKITDGRPPQAIGFDGPLGPGRYAETIYWNLLEAGLRVAPLAGTGPKSAPGQAVTVGYNRVYATAHQGDGDDPAGQPFSSAAACLDAVWAGHSVVSNGPMLRPLLGGYPPGHVFQSAASGKLTLGMELDLAVRDEVDYLEIIHNGRVFHSARLDEFAAAGGRLPEMNIDQSGWAVVRVVTRHEDHFRMATSAPWYFEFDNQARISRQAVQFFGRWLVDCESRLRALPPDQIAPHVPHVVAARKFWTQRLALATVD
ncbi:MAG: hypothetical protein ACO1RT_00065, partial [Planctomycetaceae bacterium]